MLMKCWQLVKPYFCALALGVSCCFFVGCETLNTAGISKVLSSAGSGANGLSSNTIVAGLKEALQVGTRNAVEQTASEGGYLNNEAIRIPIPEKLQKMASGLRKIGLGGRVDQFETKMNRAAEQAAAKAAPVFLDAIKEMSFAEARDILQGHDTAATEYFRGATEKELTRRYQPIVSQAMNSVGAVRLFEDLQTRYNKLPLVPEMNYQVEDYVVNEALNGLFHVLANEEQKIRANPAARTTDLLRRVFGN